MFSCSTCKKLVLQNQKWETLDARIRILIDRTEELHNNGQRNTPECIKLSMERKKCQEQIELVEDEIARLGSSVIHHFDNVIGSSEEPFKIVSPEKSAKFQSKVEIPKLALETGSLI
ncbi:hypothetical protein AVEN_98492-1 [Araneus ventricosus]|uniref:Uncharacterized protein n=1 Tax=Araneus ventricosus TaxID=182803 RepID=A0A4Y2NGF2_ARAVE|nr:hypothetical protein AVEN_98492-1 [Araneus ventricosus]